MLDEGITFEIILTNKAKPYVERRKQETKALIINAIAYQENFDFQMSEANVIENFYAARASHSNKNTDQAKCKVAF